MAESFSSPLIGCVIMASGLSTRFGSNKLLADFGGRPMLCRVLDATDTPALAARVVQELDAKGARVLLEKVLRETAA